MRYFFLAYALIALLVVGIFGLRGQKFSKPPVRIFPDMDEQDKLKAQKPIRSSRTATAAGCRSPDPAARIQSGRRAHIGGIPEYEFGGQTGYYYTGHVGDYYGTGMPEELVSRRRAPAS
jgi:hypothetical protein